MCCHVAPSPQNLWLYDSLFLTDGAEKMVSSLFRHSWTCLCKWDWTCVGFYKFISFVGFYFNRHNRQHTLFYTRPSMSTLFPRKLSLMFKTFSLLLMLFLFFLSENDLVVLNAGVTWQIVTAVFFSTSRKVSLDPCNRGSKDHFGGRQMVVKKKSNIIF